MCEDLWKNKKAIECFNAKSDELDIRHPEKQTDIERDDPRGNGFFAACPGLRHSVDALIAEGDSAAANLTIRGTQTKPLVTPTGSIPPSGKSFVLPVINFYRFKDGKVIEHHSAFDMLTFLQQIGAMPGG